MCLALRTQTFCTLEKCTAQGKSLEAFEVENQLLRDAYKSKEVSEASGARGRPGRLGRVLPALPCGPRLAAAGQPHRAPAPPRIPIAVLPLLRASPCGLSQCTSCSPEQKPRASAGRPPTDRPASPWQAALQSRQTVRGEGCHVSGGCGSREHGS